MPPTDTTMARCQPSQRRLTRKRQLAAGACSAACAGLSAGHVMSVAPRRSWPARRPCGLPADAAIIGLMTLADVLSRRRGQAARIPAAA